MVVSAAVVVVGIYKKTNKKNQFNSTPSQNGMECLFTCQKSDTLGRSSEYLIGTYRPVEPMEYLNSGVYLLPSGGFQWASCNSAQGSNSK